MGDEFPNVADKLPFDGIDGALEKEEWIPTRSELFPPHIFDTRMTFYGFSIPYFNFL